jgi:hypothetical protein
MPLHVPLYAKNAVLEGVSLGNDKNAEYVSDFLVSRSARSMGSALSQGAPTLLDCRIAEA